MKLLVFCLSMAVLAGSARSEPGAQAPRLQMTLRDGRVTIVARDVPLTDILAEWSRLGQTRIVNGDKLAGPRLTIQLVDVTERDALDILLRSAAGYIAAPRPADRPGPSRYDRVTILASSRPPAAVVTAAAPPESPRASYVSSPYAAAPAAAAAPEPEPPADAEPAPDFTTPQGAQPVPPQQRVRAAFPGMAPQLETAQPRGLKLSDLLRKAGEVAGPPQSTTKPGPVPGPGGRGGGH